MSMKRATLGGRKLRQKAIHSSLSALPTPNEAVERILSVYAQATEEECLEGSEWYLHALEHATYAAYGAKSVEHACGIVAALSPQCSWDQNLVNAELVCDGTPDLATQSHNAIDKAVVILQGANPTDTLGGRKVRSFSRNLSSPHRAGAVTIDRHALAIVLGVSAAKDPRAAKLLERVGTYQYVAACYRSAARRVGILPQDMQAITWLVWRRKHAPGWAARDRF